MIQGAMHLTDVRQMGYYACVAGKIQQPGLTARYYGGHRHLFLGGFFVSIFHSIAPFGQAVWGAARLAGAVVRSVNPHGLPFLFDGKKGGVINLFLRSIAMYELSTLLLEADANRTPTITRLEDFPQGIEDTGDALTHALSLLLPEMADKDLDSQTAVAARIIALTICNLGDCCDVMKMEVSDEC